MDMINESEQYLVFDQELLSPENEVEKITSYEETIPLELPSIEISSSDQMIVESNIRLDENSSTEEPQENTDADIITGELSNKVPTEVVDSLVMGESVQLIVEYETDEIEPQINFRRQQQGLTDEQANTSSITDFKAQAYQDLEAEVLSSLPGIEILKDYSHLPLNFVEVSTTEDLIELLENPDVVQVYPDQFNTLFDDSNPEEQNKQTTSVEDNSIVPIEPPQAEATQLNDIIDRPTLAQSLPQINQPTAEAAGYTGAGTTVAVLDTGANPNAPGLVGRIVFAQDFAPDDGSDDDSGHGTNVSAIAAGVAPDTDIAALDVFTGGGAYVSDQIDAMNWSIANQATYNIVAMNMSLGGGQYFSPVTSDPRYLVIQDAKAAGILTITSSGNDHWSTSMGAPGAIEGAISVGAVDTGDRVADFSNSASFLDLLAPGVNITAGGLSNYSGTSMAAPHVSGAVAVLAAADPTASPEDIVNTLKTTGISVTDNRNSLDFPRIDLALALGLTPPPPPSEDNYEENDTLATAHYPGYNWERTWLSGIDGVGIAKDEDWYEIDVSPAGYERILVDLQFTHADGDIDLELYDSSGTLLASSDSTTDDESIDYTASSTGSYYLKVYSDSNSGNTYDLWWDDVPPPPPLNDDNYEENDNLASAYDLSTLEQTWLSSIDGVGIANDDDWYEIEVDSGEEQILVDLQFTHADGDIDLQLYDSSGTFLTGSTSVSDNESINYTVSNPGTYYLHVYPFSGSGNTYDLWWDDVAVSVTPGNIDLSGSYFDVIQEPLEAGDSFDVDFEIQNTESDNAGGFWADFYLSSDPIIDNSFNSDDILLDYQWIPSLAGNSTTGILSQNLILPDASDSFWTGDGTYYIGVISDALDGIVETDETNNASTGEFVDYDGVQITISQPTTGVDNDFDGDGKADIHWRNGSQNQVWLMDGTTVNTQSNIDSLDSSWVAVGNGDFDGNGKADLIYRNGNQTQIFEMDGTTVVSQFNIDNFNSAWSIAGIGDTDGDGDDDILFRNSNKNRIWEMEDFNVVNKINIGNFNSAWSVVGLGDTDGDGDDDIMFRNANKNRLWEMQDNTRLNTLNIGGFNSAWQVGDVEDYDGDGDDDIMFRNGDQNQIWEMENNAVVNKTNTDILDSSWALIG